nr:MAG TPA: hypothetical protein [Caudoviricetes sp.]
MLSGLLLKKNKRKIKIIAGTSLRENPQPSARQRTRFNDYSVAPVKEQ